MIHTDTGAAPRPRDPMHDRPTRPNLDELRHDLESLHGRALHGERTAVNPAARNAFHLMAQWLDQILWPEVAA
jgi:hypothetical protein